MRLLSNESSFDINIGAWEAAYYIGLRYGWSPLGTVAPKGWITEESEPWDKGNYFTNDGQTVSKEDATSWSAALKQAIDDIPNEDCLGSDTFCVKKIPDPIEFFSGKENKRVLRQLAGFLGRGKFKIF